MTRFAIGDVSVTGITDLPDFQIPMATLFPASDPGQLEASRSLGLGYLTSMRKVVVPQAFEIMTPSLINQLVILLKDSSLLLAIGFAELLYQGQQIYAGNFRVAETLLIVGVMYFIVIMALTKLANFVDKKVNK